jgi:hypothetical protein
MAERTDSQNASYPKTAACACGALKVTVTAPPQMVHACACADCQRSTGSAFSYSAFFPESVVEIAGDLKTWRRSSDSARWNESGFCPTCGVTVICRLEALPGIVGVSVGCFNAPDFPGPGRLYWNSRRHQWLELPIGIERVDTQ